MNHNDIDGEAAQPSLPFKLRGSAVKTAFALRHNLEVMIQGGVVDATGKAIPDALLPCTAFLTLTIGDEADDGFRQVYEVAEASKRFKSLLNLLRQIFERGVTVMERHVSGAIHYHVVGILAGRTDIRTGLDFDAIRSGDYSSASTALRNLWEMLRERLPAFGFGRAELLPIEKTGSAIAAYVSKYLDKHMFNRRDEDKGKKLVRYFGWHTEHLRSNGFSWATPAACEWRLRARAIAGTHGITTKEEMYEAYGARWAWRITGVMLDLMASAHMVSDDRFAIMAREWSESAMLYPDWWRDLEDKYRWADEAHEPVEPSWDLIEEIYEFWRKRNHEAEHIE